MRKYLTVPAQGKAREVGGEPVDGCQGAVNRVLGDTGNKTSYQPRTQASDDDFTLLSFEVAAEEDEMV